MSNGGVKEVVIMTSRRPDARKAPDECDRCGGPIPAAGRRAWPGFVCGPCLADELHEVIEGEVKRMLVKDSAGDFELPPAGMHPAFCINWFDIGIQPGFEGKPTHQVVGLFELVCLDDAGQEIRMTKGDNAGKRFLLARTYTFSLGELASLSIDLINWRGREFTAEERAGFELDVTKRKACQLNVLHYTNTKGNQRAKYTTINPAARGLSLTPETPDSFVPSWVGKLMATATQSTVAAGTGAADDEIPF